MIEQSNGRLLQLMSQKVWKNSLVFNNCGENVKETLHKTCPLQKKKTMIDKNVIFDCYKANTIFLVLAINTNAS